MDTINSLKDIIIDDNLETNLIEKKLSKTNLLKTRFDLEESEIYHKSNQKLCVFNYNTELKNAEEFVENFIETKSLEISNNSEYRVIGWNKNSIFFLKD
jgi:hypothetical protein